MQLFAAFTFEMFEYFGDNVAAARTQGFVMAGIVLLSLGVRLIGKRVWIWSAVVIGLLLLHPVRTLPDERGRDLGEYKRDVSYFFTAFGGLVLCCQVALKFGALRDAMGLDEGVKPLSEGEIVWWVGDPEPSEEPIRDRTPDTGRSHAISTR